MKQFLLASLFFLGLAQIGTAQLSRVVVERTVDGNANLCGASTQPEGTSTYRVYAELQDADDLLSAIAALEGCHPLNISTTTSFYNSPIGGALGSSLNTALCGAFPEGGFDSFITIGQESSSDAGLTQTAFTNPTSPLDDSFVEADGTNFEISDGAIYTLNGNTNGIPVGPNNRVFLGQFTTDGDFSFDINLQVFDGGDGSQNLFYVSSGELDCVYDPANPFPNMPTVIDGSEIGLIYDAVNDCTPVNDLCSGAINIDDQINQGPFTVDNSCATVSGIFDNDCFEDGCNDLWYSFTYNGGTVIVETILNNPDYSCDEGLGYLGDSRIAVFQDCDGALVDCNDDNQDLESLIALDGSSLILGDTYYVQVGGYSSVANQDGCIEDALGIFEVQISNCSVINDECTGAINIDDQVNQGPFTVNNSCATVSGIVDVDCFEDGCNDLWYSFIYFGGEVTVETILSGTLWDSRLAVYSDCSGTLVACNDDNEDLESLIELDGDDLIIGNSYYLQVGGYSSGNNSGGDAYGTFEVEISLDGVLGCTDESALNYNAEANVDNDTCVYQELDINDTPSTAEPLALDIAAGPGSSCNGYSGENLNGASASTQESITSSLFDELPGLWYSFVPYSSGNQITVETEDFDAVIEVFDTNLLQLEGVDGMEANANAGAGDEIFQIGNLTAGNTYYVRVTSTTEISEAANFDICIQTFRDTRCDYLPGTYSLCQMYKADYVFADAYQFHFTSQTTGITYSSDAQISTFLVLRNVEGLPFGDVYDVEIEAIYYMPNGAGTIQTVVVANDEPCEISIIDAPIIKMRSLDNNMNHGPHYPGNFIRTNTYACSALAYTWKFTRTDVPELPQEYTTATSSTFVRISDVLGNGVTPGSVYDVQVKPIFANGQEAEYGEVESISIIGAAGAVGDVIVANEFVEDAQRNEIELAPESKVYPNPTSGSVNIAMSKLEVEQELELRVSDFLGRTIFQSTQVAKDGNVLMHIDLSTLSTGTYLMHISAGEYVHTEKLVIVK
jgi:hypothetical protein